MLVDINLIQNPFYSMQISNSFKLYYKAVATNISLLQAVINFCCLENDEMVLIFEDEGISQQRRNILITSFIILLLSLMMSSGILFEDF